MRWLARSDQDVPAGTAWLDAREAGRAAGMRVDKRRGEYRLRRYVGKSAVATVLGMAESEYSRIAVLNDPTGAPYVEVDGGPCGLAVSLADRAGWAVCLVSDQGEQVGIDLELIEPRSAGFIRDYFTHAEQLAVTGGPLEQAVAANLIWSAKEASLKVLRVGLAADARTVEVLLGTQPDDSGWRPLVARIVRPLPELSAELQALVADPEALPAELPGWWRRGTSLLLTVVSAGLAGPPVMLPGSRALL